MRVLKGTAKILGRIIKDSDDIAHEIYSPNTSALLFIDIFSDDSEIFEHHLEIQSLRNGLEFLTLPSLDAESNDPTFRIFLQNDSDLGEFSLLDIPDHWYSLSDDMLLRPLENSRLKPSIITCGPRKVGKSTFGRFIVNRLLNNYEKVAYLDLDCGQTEFSLPGFLSLQILGRDSQNSLLGKFF